MWYNVLNKYTSIDVDAIEELGDEETDKDE